VGKPSKKTGKESFPWEKEKKADQTVGACTGKNKKRARKFQETFTKKLTYRGVGHGRRRDPRKDDNRGIKSQMKETSRDVPRKGKVQPRETFWRLGQTGHGRRRKIRDKRDTGPLVNQRRVQKQEGKRRKSYFC